MTDEKETYERWNNFKLNKVNKLEGENTKLKGAVKIFREQLKDQDDLANRQSMVIEEHLRIYQENKELNQTIPPEESNTPGH